MDRDIFNDEQEKQNIKRDELLEIIKNMPGIEKCDQLQAPLSTQ